MHRLSFAFLYSLHFGDIADVTEININLLFGVLLELFTPFVNDYLRNEGVQDLGGKLGYARILFSKTYELIHIACRLLQILYLLFQLRQLGIYALLLIRIATGQYTELLVVYPAEDIVLIQPLE